MAKLCTRCVMDADCPRIEFDEHGVCSFCRTHEEAERKKREENNHTPQRLQEIVEGIKQEGKGKDFDCVLGVSGGFDSSYVAMWAKDQGLRPLCFHLDNGWNTTVSSQNIKQLISRLGFPLQTIVLDWEEFKDIQMSFFKASVVDIELPTDIAIFAAFFQTAYENGTQYVINGSNPLSESGHFMPVGWNHYKFDFLNVMAIQHQFGTRKMHSFPVLDPYRYQLYKFRNGIRVVDPLHYLPDFDLAEGKQRLEQELGWVDYGQKHSESLFTKFYQRYILPRKFGVDKRKPHFSTMVMTGQMTREEALRQLEQPAYDDPDELARDKAEVFRKLELTEEEFEALMALPIRRHTEFPSEAPPHKWEK